MKINIMRNGLQIIPENEGHPHYDERDTAYIEEVLGLRKEGDFIKLVRKNATGFTCLAYLETEKE